MDRAAWAFGQSIDSDLEMWDEEIDVSIAHAEMLGETGIIPTSAANATVVALEEIRNVDKISWPQFEDIHAAIEHLLEERIGEDAKSLTAARSRNDQIATVTRLWLIRKCARLTEELKSFQHVVVNRAEQYVETPMPGYTHQQPAQPITLGFHLLAYFWMLQRDKIRFETLRFLACDSPLGAGALSGTSLPINREMTSSKLGFEYPSPNALDSVSDRDFVGDALHACATLMQHCSRISQELILWSTHEFQFVKLAEEFTTGSSLMPQKRNPDICELIRGRSARTIGNWTTFMAMMKALPLAYNRDMQDDKPPLFDSMRLSLESVGLLSKVVETCEFKIVRLREGAGAKSSTATRLAEWLVAHGVPFRVAHKQVGQIVIECETRGLALDKLSLSQLRNFVPNADEECVSVLTVDGCIASQSSHGGTAPAQVRAQLAEAKALLN